jgi:hypothetical protein
MNRRSHPKINLGLVAIGILTIAAVGLIGSHVVPAPAPIVVKQEPLAVQNSFQTNERVSIIPAVELIPVASLQRATAENYLPVSAWYKSKGWWKRHAPIIGGAAGGGVIGGLAGGGKGAIIGGAAGAGGGYLYKHMRDRNHRHTTAYRAGKPTPKQPERGK